MDLQAEVGVVGAVLLDAQRLQLPGVAKLRPADFADDAHARLWEVIRTEREQGKPLDLQVIIRRLAQQPGEVLGYPFLQKVTDGAGTGYAAEYFAEIVLDKSRLRRQFYFAHKLQEQIAAGLPSDDVAGFIERHNEEERSKGAGESTVGSFLAMARKKENHELHAPIIDKIVREGETINIVSDSKVGKSWLTLGLGLSICAGRDWMGFPIEQGKVLYLDNELHEPTFCYRVKQIARAMALPEEEYAEHLHVECYRGRLADINAVCNKLRRITPGTYKIVVLDSLYRFAPKGFDENSNPDTTEMYNLLDSVAMQIGCAIICIRHSSKGSQSGKSVTDTGAGAGAQSRAVDAHIILRAHEEAGAFVMAGALRSFPPLPPAVVRFEWPMFFAAPDLDPALLAPERPRRAAAAKADKPAEEVWTTDRFKEQFLTAEPQSRDEIEQAAIEHGLTKKQAAKLAGLVTGNRKHSHLWKEADARRNRYANVPQPPFQPELKVTPKAKKPRTKKAG